MVIIAIFFFLTTLVFNSAREKHSADDESVYRGKGSLKKHHVGVRLDFSLSLKDVV